MSFKEVIIIDDFLKNKSGHFYEYDKAVINSLKDLGIATKIYGSINMDDSIKNELNATPSFEFHMFDYLYVNANKKSKFITGKIFFYFYYFKNTYSILKKIRKRDKVILFFPNLLRIHFLPLSFLLFVRIRKLPKVVLVYRSSIAGKKNKVALYYRISNWFIRNSVSKGSIVVTSDSEVIVEEMNDFFGYNALLFPIPHIYDIEPALNTVSDKKLKFICLVRQG
jgi:hypothetical protein